MLALGGIVLLALGLRLWGIKYGLPFGYQIDEERIYEMTLERLGLEAGACLFVDDLLPNIEGARALGMNAVHFRDNEQATAEIRAALAT